MGEAVGFEVGRDMAGAGLTQDHLVSGETAGFEHYCGVVVSLHLIVSPKEIVTATDGLGNRPGLSD